MGLRSVDLDDKMGCQKLWSRIVVESDIVKLEACLEGVEAKIKTRRKQE